MPRPSLPAHRSGRGARAPLLALLLALGCGQAPAPEPPRTETTDTAAASPAFIREFVFLGERGGEPVVVPFAFSAVPRGANLARSARGWLAVGGAWDPFLDETRTTPAAGGAWLVLPHGDLRVLASAQNEVEALVFRGGERSLRLEPLEPLSAWRRREDMQHRLLRARLGLAGETLAGQVLEVSRVERRAAPAREAAATGSANDWLFVSDGNALRLLLAEAFAGADASLGSFAWMLHDQDERAWDAAEIRWVELRAVEAARRDAPIRWSFRIPDAELYGEVVSRGSDLQLGPERAGRRGIEAFHTVEGWVEMAGERRPVFGMLRHTQD